MNDAIRRPRGKQSKMKTLIAVTVALALAGCCGSDDAVCTQAQYNAMQSMQPAFYNLGTALRR
jgi:hypothetical protein